MDKIKRIEIVILEVKARDLCEALGRKGITGLTVIYGAEGFGNRGHRYADELTGVSQNAYILIGVEEEQLEAITPIIRQALREFGGVCFISDANYLKH